MVEVIPTIIAKDFKELKEKIKLIEPHVDWAQLDIMDGRFVGNTTWNNPADLKNLETKLNLEAHLMVENPEEVIKEWAEAGVKRIIFHYESTDNVDGVISRIKEAGPEAGLAVNPETDIEKIDSFVKKLDLILVMTVHPGRGGQEFLEGTLVKIKNLRTKYPYVKIQVDGGINLKTAPKVIGAGANLLAAGSAVFKSDNIAETINDLKSMGY